jgi:two-component system OmpR family sensor kinase
MQRGVAIKVSLERCRTCADAAHELHSPLAALKLQLQAATRSSTLKDDGQTLERIDMRLNRIIRLLQQLLTLAREDAQAAIEGTVVSLRRIGDSWRL